MSYVSSLGDTSICPKTITITENDGAVDTSVFTWDDSTLTLVTQSSDISTYNDVVKTISITILSHYSRNAANEITFTFDVHLKHSCYDTTISGGLTFAETEFEYDLWTSETMTFSNTLDETNSATGLTGFCGVFSYALVSDFADLTLQGSQVVGYSES